MEKILPGFFMKEIGGLNYIIARPEANPKFCGVVRLNSSGVLLWKLLELGNDRNALIDNLLETYDVTRETAERDVSDFLCSLRSVGILTPEQDGK